MILSNTSSGMLLRFKVFNPHNFMRDVVYLSIGVLVSFLATTMIYGVLTLGIPRLLIMVVWFFLYYAWYGYSRFVYAYKKHVTAVKSAFYVFTQHSHPNFVNEIKHFLDNDPFIRSYSIELPVAADALPYERICVFVVPNKNISGYCDELLAYRLERFFISYVSEDLVLEAFCCVLQGEVKND